MVHDALREQCSWGHVHEVCPVAQHSCWRWEGVQAQAVLYAAKQDISVAQGGIAHTIRVFTQVFSNSHMAGAVWSNDQINGTIPSDLHYLKCRCCLKQSQDQRYNPYQICTVGSTTPRPQDVKPQPNACCAADTSSIRAASPAAGYARRRLLSYEEATLAQPQQMMLGRRLLQSNNSSNLIQVRF